MFKKIIKNQQGATALMLTLLILTSVLTVSLTIADVIRNGLIMDKTQFGSTQAYFAAEAAAERILWATRYGGQSECTNGEYVCFDAETNSNISGCGSSCGVDYDYQKLSNGAEYKIYFTINGLTTTITNIGTYQDINRVVELRY
jgi:uncharacterized protein (UPF0333 family)